MTKEFYTSLELASMFQRRHSSILREIDKIGTEREYHEFHTANFRESSYRGVLGIIRRMYKINRSGFLLLAMGLEAPQATGIKIECIKAFNTLESSFSLEEE